MPFVRYSLYACGLSTVLLSAVVATAIYAPPHRTAAEPTAWTTVVIKE